MAITKPQNSVHKQQGGSLIGRSKSIRQPLKEPKSLTKTYRSWAWCRCGDNLTNCGVGGTEAEAEIKRRHPRVSYYDRQNWFYCFGCDEFYRIAKVIEHRSD
jgi:hypothetical protein